jgi:hypothetical protein
MFDASEVVEELGWDFSKFGQGKGITPEPSDRQLSKFQKQFQALLKVGVQMLKTVRPPQSPPSQSPPAEEVLLLDEAVRVLGDMSGEEPELERFHEMMAQITADVCTNQPSKEQLLALPPRIRMAFYGWLNGQILNPKFLELGMKRLLVMNGHEKTTM